MEWILRHALEVIDTLSMRKRVVSGAANILVVENASVS